MQELGSGRLDKMRGSLGGTDAPVAYTLPLGGQEVELNSRIGSRLRLEFLGLISCAHCGRRSSRSFAQGYCYPCFQRLARCDSCIVKPQTCHFSQGTCREPEWAGEFCMSDHVVYLANSSGLKVGITRASQIPVRWIDQGAVQALPLLRVATREQSGHAEVMFGASVADKTNWRAMLKGAIEPVDLPQEAERLLEQYGDAMQGLRERFGADALRTLPDARPVEISYPVLQYPAKPVSLNLDKTPLIEGTLLGIKGQYLILDTGVLNVRNLTSYHVRLSAAA
jgi:hypothetical protein